MTADRLRSTLRQSPFRPFTIRTSSGEAYLVSHPEVMWCPPGADVVLVSTREADAVTIAMLDLAAVADVVYRVPVES